MKLTKDMKLSSEKGEVKVKDSDGKWKYMPRNMAERGVAAGTIQPEDVVGVPYSSLRSQRKASRVSHKDV